MNSKSLLIKSLSLTSEAKSFLRSVFKLVYFLDSKCADDVVIHPCSVIFFTQRSYQLNCLILELLFVLTNSGRFEKMRNYAVYNSEYFLETLLIIESISVVIYRPLSSVDLALEQESNSNLRKTKGN